MSEAPGVDATVRKIEDLLEAIGAADQELRARTEEVIRLLLQLYGSGLARIVEMLGPDAAMRLADDKLLASLLLLHGMHPVDAPTRITEALHRIERRLDGHRVYLAGIDGEVARVQVSLNGGLPPPGLAAAIEHALAECAPDIAAVAIEGLPQPAPVLVQIAPTVGS